MSKKILCVGNKFYGNCLVGLRDISCDVEAFMKDPNDFCLVMFTGGADVSPKLYGDESPDHLCQSNPTRDRAEELIFKMAHEHNIKMTGICRGLQFLNVMSGGKLMHHINRHGGSNHTFECHASNNIIEVNSLHHQMVIPSEHSLIIGWSHDKLSNVYYGESDAETDYVGPEVEAALYPETLSCGVQYHPEMMGMETEGHIWYFQLMKDFLEMSMHEFIKIYAEQRKRYAG